MSPVDIANLAPTAVGTRSTILSFTEANPEATVINQWYDLVRRQILRAALWGFARQFFNLALIPHPLDDALTCGARTAIQLT